MTQDNGRQALGEIMAAVEHALGGAAPVAVATVVDAGELGIEVGAKMLVRRDGTTVGSIDGAVVDAQVVTEAMAAFEQFPRAVLQSMYVGRAHEAVARRSQAQPGDARLMLEVFEAPARLVVVGGGHVGLQIANFGALLGFRITVIDDRPEFANPERFPMRCSARTSTPLSTRCASTRRAPWYWSRVGTSRTRLRCGTLRSAARATWG